MHGIQSYISCFSLILAGLFAGIQPAAADTTKLQFSVHDETKVLILEVRGLTFEMLERAYTPNINYLIANGMLTTMEQREVASLAIGQRRTGSGVRGKIGRLANCLDSTYSIKSSLYTTGISSDTIIGYFSQRRKNFRSNESMIKDFVNSGNASNVRFSFISFRTIGSVNGFVDREQINSLTTIDSLIGIVFKSYQEKLKWDKTSVVLLTDGTASHHYRQDDPYSFTPLIVTGNGIPKFVNLEQSYSSDDVLDLALQLMGVECEILTADYTSTKQFTRTDEKSNIFFLPRPDILISRFANKNQYGMDLSTDIEDVTLFYTINGSDPRTSGIQYRGQVLFKDPGVYPIRAVALKNGHFSVVTEHVIKLRDGIYSVDVYPLPDPKYTWDGVDELIDEDTANVDFAVDKWLGFQGQDVTIEFNFGDKRVISGVDLTALQDFQSWIFFPVKVTAYIGNDKNNMVEAGSVSYEVSPNDNQKMRRHFNIGFTQHFINSLGSQYIKKQNRSKYLNVRYLTLKIENIKTAPDWFSLPGAQTWFFTDEVRVY